MNKTQILNRGIAKFNLLSLVLLLAALLFSVSNTYSQQDKSEKKQRITPEERAQKRADKMKEKLSLTDDQHKQIYDIVLSQSKEMKSVWESSKNDQDKTARRDKMKAIREAGKTQINSVLDANQQQLWETHKKEMKEKHKSKKHKGKKNKGSKKELK